MTKNLTAYAIAKGYEVIQTPICIDLPFFGWVWLPLWLASEPEFKSRKGCRYTLEGFVWKLQRKYDKKRTDRITRKKRAEAFALLNQTA